MIVCRNSSGLLHEDGDLPATTTIDHWRGSKVIHENYYKNNLPHRMFGPAVISYDDDGSIIYSKFYVKGLLIGENKEGFWALWSMLSDDDRKHATILKYLVIYS
jgi:hypothetical protein